jgi:hypothetical protein
LETALDYGIKEIEFWEMTVAELERSIASKQRVDKIREKEKAAHNYILASLIGKNIMSVMSNNSIPTIEEIYPSLFDDEIQARKEEKEAQQTELSIIRLKQFAKFHNAKYEEV